MNESVRVGAEEIPVWPAGQALAAADSARTLIMTRFEDHARYHPRLIDTIMTRTRAVEEKRTQQRIIGGAKAFGVGDWDCPAARLVNERAKALFRQALKRDTAVVDLSWANVYRSGDYAIPHSHVRAVASLVYYVDLGDPDTFDPMAGRFGIVDPRHPICCNLQPGHLTSPFFPDLAPGMMIVFPGQTVHTVNPYFGVRPRITMAWNINPTALGGDAAAAIGSVELA
jgi:Putative 2OG-Fe(II) oxygenase